MLKRKNTRLSLHIQSELCIGCRACTDRCRRGAIEVRSLHGVGHTARLDPDRCSGCGHCARVCPVGAIEWM